MKKLVSSLVLGASLGMANNAVANEQTITFTAEDFGLSNQQFVELLASLEPDRPASSPSISFGSPVGFGAVQGVVGFGFGGSTLPDTADDDLDGSAGIGLGFGSADKLGVEVSVNIISLREQFAEDGNVGLKLHRVVGNGTSVAVGVNNLIPWGDADTVDESYYGVISKIVPEAASALPFGVAGTIGVTDAVIDPTEDDYNIFAALAIIPSDRYSLLADWSGEQLALGLSVVPFYNLPITISGGFINVTEEDEVEREFAGSFGYSYNY